MNESARICWVVTGAGHFLREVTEFLEGESSLCVDLFFTRAGLEVASRYQLRERLEAACADSGRETDFSASGSVYFSSGRYRLLVIAPATANTVAKCALGVADSLASNFFAQAGKSRVPIVILPTDLEPEVVSVTPSGRDIAVFPREVDLRRVEELACFAGVSVARGAGGLAKLIGRFAGIDDG